MIAAIKDVQINIPGRQFASDRLRFVGAEAFFEDLFEMYSEVTVDRGYERNDRNHYRPKQREMDIEAVVES